VKVIMMSNPPSFAEEPVRHRRCKARFRLQRASLLSLVFIAILVGASDAGAATSSDLGATSTTTSTSTTSTSTTSTTSSSSVTAPAAPLRPFITAAGIAGTGSSFASPAVTNWANTVGQSPYNISVNYTPSNSGQGRYEFTNGTVDYAVSDTGYVSSSVGTTPPSFAYEFIPITAAGVAFMYDIPGLNGTLQLTSYTACLLLTGQISNWNDPALKQNGANANVNLPNMPVKPVTESDPAGTNFVLEEYCIQEQPAVWAQYAKNEAGSPPPSGVPINPTTPNSNWQAPANGLDESSTSAVASNVANTPGSIGPVQDNYATDSGFTGSNPARAVAEMQNKSGKFTLPSPANVASALAYASQQANGTHVLDFNGLGPNVYNPSTYSYLLTPTTGWSTQKGATMSQFVNYVLTLGQQAAPKFGYASLGLSLERYGIDEVIAHVPGAVDPTAAESAAYACGDLTPAEVQAGQTTPTCGVTNGNPPPPPPGAANIATVNGNSKSNGTKTGATSGSSAGGGSGSSGADPGVSLANTSAMAGTGSNPAPLIALGVLLLTAGTIGRRRLKARRVGGSS
jgi:ABC-type phosphate transport system substrate-binding protein